MYCMCMAEVCHHDGHSNICVCAIFNDGDVVVCGSSVLSTSRVLSASRSSWRSSGAQATSCVGGILCVARPATLPPTFNRRHLLNDLCVYWPIYSMWLCVYVAIARLYDVADNGV